MSQHTTDRELLELAAKAAGIKGDYKPKCICVGDPNNHGIYVEATWLVWNPLTDDGDALRLGAALRLHILHNDPDDSVLWVSAVLNKRGFHGVVEFQDEVQRTGATRRAIVLAAAAIGEAQCHM